LVVEESQDLRFADGPKDAVASEYVCEVDERAGDGRDRNPLLCCHIVRMKPPRAVDLHAVQPAPRPPRRRHMHPGARAVIDLPERSSIEMAQQGP
jgi:hypothetical protein